jgi:hypothetical protein
MCSWGGRRWLGGRLRQGRNDRFVFSVTADALVMRWRRCLVLVEDGGGVVLDEGGGVSFRVTRAARLIAFRDVLQKKQKGKSVNSVHKYMYND